MTGERFPALVNIADRGIIRILDLPFIRMEFDEGASSGLLDEGDIGEAGQALRPGSSVGILGR